LPTLHRSIARVEQPAERAEQQERANDRHADT
jgi:hypothetical protein